jgi:single-strand DNA-binding protein
MNDTTITLRGNVGSDVALRDAGDAQVANFRVGSTPRVLNRTTGEWSDGVTQWYTVNAWRRLALNVKRSVCKGDPVIVHGRLTVKEWADKDGVLRTSLEVEAESVGHDLLRGTSAFVRPPRVESGPVASTAEPGAEPSWAVPGAEPAADAADLQDGDPIADWRAA